MCHLKADGLCFFIMTGSVQQATLLSSTDSQAKQCCNLYFLQQSHFVLRLTKMCTDSIYKWYLDMTIKNILIKLGEGHVKSTKLLHLRNILFM